MKIVQIGIAVILLLNSVPAAGQQYDDWEVYPSMYRMNSVMVHDGFVYGASTQGMFRYDPDIEEYRYYFKKNGLEEQDLLTMESVGDILYLGFRQGGLIRFDTRTETFEPILFPEYVNTSDVTRSIAVNDIVALNDSILFVAHDTGIDRLNLNQEEVRTYDHLATFSEKLEVFQIVLYQGSIWACTNEGLAWAPVDDPNLESHTSWIGKSFSGSVTSMFPYEDSVLFVGTNLRGVVLYDLVNDETIPTMDTGIVIEHISPALGTVIAATRNNGLMIWDDGTWLNDTTSTDTRWLAADGDDTVWIATAFDGMLQYQSDEYVTFPAMNMSTSSDIRSLALTGDNVIWAATSARDGGGKVQRFEDGQWHSYRSLDTVFMNKTVGMHADSRGTVWGVCWGDPIFSIDDGGTADPSDDHATTEDPQAEYILPFVDGANYVVTTDITEDHNGNIWVAGYTRGAYVFPGDRPITEHAFTRIPFADAGVSSFYSTCVTTDPDGWVWLGTLSTGLFGLKYGADPYDTSDDYRAYIRGGGTNGDLYGSHVYAVAVDQNGDVWVGSDSGLNRIRKDAGDDLDVYEENTLLDVVTTEVFAIEVDGMNNKWIGTSQGLYKVNDENRLIAHYTESNSGLLSDSILSLLYDTGDNRLLIGTTAGLNIFHVFGAGDSAGEQASHAYPNPFELWGTDSRVTFNGLAEDEPLRIYTFNGELVTELTADEPDGRGGYQATWSGINDRGEMVGTGVFFFTGTNQYGRAFRDKLAVVRR